MTQIIEYLKIKENFLVTYFNFERIDDVSGGYCCLSLNKFISFNDWRCIYSNLDSTIQLYLHMPQTPPQSETVYMKNSNLTLRITWEKTDPFLVFLAGLSNKHDYIFPYMMTVQVNIASNIDEYMTARESNTSNDSQNNVQSADVVHKEVINVSESSEDHPNHNEMVQQSNECEQNQNEMVQQVSVDEATFLFETFVESGLNQVNEENNEMKPAKNVPSKKRKSTALNEGKLMKKSKRLSRRIIVTRGRSSVKMTPKSKSTVKFTNRRGIKKRINEKANGSTVSNSSTSSSLFNVSRTRQVRKPMPKKPPKQNKKQIDLSSLTSRLILKSFDENAASLKAIFMEFLEQENHSVKRSTEYDHIKVMSFLDSEHIDQMLELFYTHFVDTDLNGSLSFTNLFFEVMVPEWIVSIIMKKYRLNRKAAIAQINAQGIDETDN